MRNLLVFLASDALLQDQEVQLDGQALLKHTDQKSDMDISSRIVAVALLFVLWLGLKGVGREEKGSKVEPPYPLISETGIVSD